DVVHQHLAHADPRVVDQADDGGEGQHLHPLRVEHAGPLVVADLAAGEQHLREDPQREERHQDARDALREPVAQAVARTDDDAAGTVVDCHLSVPPQYRPNSLAPSTTVSSRLAAMVTLPDVAPNCLLTALWLTSIQMWRRPAMKWC